MLVKSIGVYVSFLLGHLSSMAICNPIISGQIAPVNGTEISGPPSDDFDIFIGYGWDQVMAKFAANNPKPTLIQLIKKRNPYRFAGGIRFRYKELTTQKDGIIGLIDDKWTRLTGQLEVDARRQPFDWKNKPMTVTEAIELVKSTPGLTPVQKEMNFDDLSVAVSWQIPSIPDGRIIFRFKRQDAYRIYVDTVAKRVVFGASDTDVPSQGVDLTLHGLCSTEEACVEQVS